MYYPILKGKAGEFDAWKNVSGRRRAQICPLFEIVPEKDIASDLKKFRDGIVKSSSRGDVVAIDFSELDYSEKVSDSGLSPYVWMASELSKTSIHFYAVVHLDDGLDRVRDAIQAVGSENLLLRVHGVELDPEPLPNDTTLENWCIDHQIRPEDIAIMIDLHSIHGLDPLSVSDLASAALSWVADNGPWDSVILSSSAFPQQISDLKKGMYHFIERSDAALWKRMKKIMPDLHYSDYGTRHPDLPQGQIWNGPLPNLRYTTAAHWIVWREGKDAQQGFSTFYDVCVNIVAHPEYLGAKYSWGDGLIDNKSRRIPGPGAGQQWISYGLNHHLELVADRLSTVRVP